MTREELLRLAVDYENANEEELANLCLRIADYMDYIQKERHHATDEHSA